MLNEYFTVITAPIERLGGVVIQYQGDAVIASFNIPVRDAAHAKNVYADEVAVWHRALTPEEVAQVFAAGQQAGGAYTYDANGNMVTRVEEGVAYEQAFDLEERTSLHASATLRGLRTSMS